MNQTEVKVRCPLVWEYDGHGTWEAVSQVMDPDMTDEPIETWCREWSLMWRISVTEDGEFCANQSDRLLLQDVPEGNRCRALLGNLQAAIDLVELHLRGCRTLGDREKNPVRLLSPETYNNRRRSL